jgi:hypothetical protein
MPSVDWLIFGELESWRCYSLRLKPKQRLLPKTILHKMKMYRIEANEGRALLGIVAPLYNAPHFYPLYLTCNSLCINAIFFYEKLSCRMVIPSYFSHQISLQPLVCHDTISNHTKGPRHDSPLQTNQPTQ